MKMYTKEQTMPGDNSTKGFTFTIDSRFNEDGATLQVNVQYQWNGLDRTQCAELFAKFHEMNSWLMEQTKASAATHAAAVAAAASAAATKPAPKPPSR